MKFTETDLIMAAQYAPPMPEGAETRIRAMTLEKTKAKRVHRHIPRRALIAACLTVVFMTGAVTANAMFDMGQLYEPIIGERAAQYLQGIHKSVAANGVTLTADAAYTDGEVSMVFFTLTDDEGRGRITDDLFFGSDIEYTTWPFNLFTVSGSHFGMLERAPDGNSARFYITKEGDISSAGRLMTLGLKDIKSGYYYEDIDVGLDLLSCLAEDLDVPLPGGAGRVVGAGFVDGVFSILLETAERGGHTAPPIMLTDGTDTVIHYDGHSVGGGDQERVMFQSIMSPAQLDGLRLVYRKAGYEYEIGGKWNVTFRHTATAETNVYTLDAPLPGGSLDTVTVTPISVTLRGEGNPEMSDMEHSWEDMIVTAGGQPAVVTSVGSSFDGTGYTYRITGIIPDDIVAVRFGGVEYPLE